MKYLFISIAIAILFTGITQTGKSQTEGICFTYDNSGNRLTRINCVVDPGEHMTVDLTSHDYKNSGIDKDEITNRTLKPGEPTITVSPNPGNGAFVVEIDGWEPGASIDLTLHTLMGNIILQKERIQPVTIININNHPDGIYILNIKFKGKEEFRKIVKK